MKEQPEQQESETVTCTIDPILTDGPAALDTHNLPGLKKVHWREARFALDNSQHETITIRSDDLSSAAVQDFSHDTRPTAVALDFEVENDPRPHHVEIIPPTTIHFQFPADAPQVLTWMEKSRLRSAITSAATLLLVTFGLFANSLTDPDPDPDDPDTDRTSCAA